MVLRPRLEMLFRPEEIILASSAPAKHTHTRRRHLAQHPVIYYDADALAAVRARIVDDDLLVPVAAADQQHEIDRSGHVELLAALERDGVK